MIQTPVGQQPRANCTYQFTPMHPHFLNVLNRLGSIDTGFVRYGCHIDDHENLDQNVHVNKTVASAQNRFSSLATSKSGQFYRCFLRRVIFICAQWRRHYKKDHIGFHHHGNSIAGLQQCSTVHCHNPLIASVQCHLANH